MHPFPPQSTSSATGGGLEILNRALVAHLHDLLTQYPEGTVVLPERDEEFASWLSGVEGFPGPIPVGVCERSALDGPLSHALEEIREASAVLVVCDVVDDDPPGGQPGDRPGHERTGADGGPPVVLPDHVDLIEVRRPSQLAGAVVEALAGDVPLVVDVRLSRRVVDALANG